MQIRLSQQSTNLMVEFSTFAAVNYLSVENVSKSFGIKILFEGLTFGISQGQKVALVARNGTGKSTLLNILMGKDTADEGRVVFNSDVQVSFLQQDHGLDDSLSILENIFAGSNDMLSAIRAYEKALNAGAEGEEFQEASDLMEQHQAWDYESKARQILGKLNLHDLNLQVKNLSGGQKRRVALAQVLIEEPDMLFLDEPTNHLDLDMIEWLEGYLEKTNMTLLMVTHDRYFLEVICDEILELENKQLYRYKGNFSYFLEKKAEREELEAATKEKARNLLRRELQWIRTQPKARTTKSKYRQGQFDGVKAMATKNLDHDTVKLEINVERLGSKLIELHKVKKAYGDKVILSSYDYVFKRKERVGIAGVNGSGKSTLIKMITGEEPVDGGKIVIGETVLFGHYSQTGISIKDNQRVLGVVKDIADVIPLKSGKKITAAELLERFLFPRSSHHDLVSKLSGGEKKRLQLLTILMKNPNVLILDEPTNDLDIFTLAILEEYLMQFPGVLVIVSHDRYMIDKLCDHILVLVGDGTVKDITGNYTSWRSKIQQKEVKQVKAKVERVKTDQPKTKLTFKEKMEFEAIEKRMPEIEEEKAELEGQIAEGPSVDDLITMSEKLGKLTEELNEIETRWLELSEYA